MTARTGHWIPTYSGVRFYPLDPRPEEVRIEDIAHALSHICRYGGHVPTFYSVAQHSVLVARCTERLLGVRGYRGQRLAAGAAYALLHDAGEAYVGDLVQPLKASGAAPRLVQAEDQIMLAVCAATGVRRTAEVSIVTKEADCAVLKAEARDLFGQPDADWCRISDRCRSAPPWPRRVVPMTPESAKLEFLNEWCRLWPQGLR